MAIPIIKPEGIISAGDSYPVRPLSSEVTGYLKYKLINSVYEHLATARELDTKIYKVFISIAPVQKLGSFRFKDTLFLGKIFAEDELIDAPDACDILLRRDELTPLWDKDLEKLYNKIIRYKSMYFQAGVLNDLATGRDLDVEDYLNKVRLNQTNNPVTRWLGGD